MSEFRFNRVTGDWVIIATESARRPEEYIIRMNRPRVSQPEGFELGSGMFINASIPEKSAKFLRNINAG